jgi:hypothetical protein
MYTWWTSDRSLNTYEEMLAAFKTARNPLKGKPVNHNWRLYMLEDNKTIRINCEGYGSEPLADVTPDNIITFIARDNHMYTMAQTYVSSFYRWFPFLVQRHRKGLYRIGSSKKIDNAMSNLKEGDSHYTQFNKVMHDMPSYFKGLQFNLLTGDCLNQKPDDKFIERPAQRKEWRRHLTQFKKGLKARAKVHALDGIAQEVLNESQAQNRWDRKKPDWSADEWQDLLENSIRKNVFPREILKGFIQTTMSSYNPAIPSPKEIMDTVDKVMNDLSIPMRRRFNVFEQEGHDEQKYESYAGGYKEVS